MKNTNSKLSINYVYEWTEPREQCWSGTPYGLYKSLSSLCCMADVDLNRKFNSASLNRLAAKLRHFFRKLLFALLRSDSNYIIKRITEKSLSKKLNSKAPSLVYTDYLCKDTEKMFVYQDLSVNFDIRYAQNHPDGYLPYESRKILTKRSLAHEKIFYQRCAGIFTMSEWLKEDMIKNIGIDPEKIQVVNAGCNVKIDSRETLAAALSRKNGRRFLFVGVDWERKNGPLVAEAFRRLREKYSDIELYIVGPASCPLPAAQDSGIFYVGQISHDDVKLYYDKCDYFVMPSEFEAFGIVFVEAMINALPCIGRDAFAMPEIIEEGKNGYLLKEESAEALSALLEKLLLNGKELTEYILAHRDTYIDKYSWDSVAAKMADFIRRNS